MEAVEIVRRFYAEIWNEGDLDAIPDICHEGIVFRGSLGDSKVGHQGFADYVRYVRGALAGYRCYIEETVFVDILEVQGHWAIEPVFLEPGSRVLKIDAGSGELLPWNEAENLSAVGRIDGVQRAFVGGQINLIAQFILRDHMTISGNRDQTYRRNR